MGCKKSNILMISSLLHTVPKLISHGRETNEKGEKISLFLMEGASVISHSVFWKQMLQNDPTIGPKK